MDDARRPVIVGVGQVNDRDNRLDPVALMQAALERADGDAGAGWIARIDSLAVVRQISFPALGDCAAALARRLCIAPAYLAQTRYPTGESPVRLLAEAANRIATGEAEVCAVVGAEALRTAALQSGGDALRAAVRSGATSPTARYGLVAPTDVYPLYENAWRAARGQTLAEGQAESGRIWAGLSEAAAANPDAWLRRAMSADEIVTRSEDNRLIAFPYLKRMVANAGVNQGAGFIIGSLAAARAAGMAENRLIHVGASAAAHESDGILARERFDASVGLRVTIDRTLSANGLTTRDLDHVELYSCFPCIPKMAAAALDWPLDRPISAFGGLTFGGGPIGNYMSHAIAAMVGKLRDEGGRALLFANGGYATHNHAIVLADAPIGEHPHDWDASAAADAERTAVPALVEQYEGAARLETYTVFYRRDGSVRGGAVVARTPDDRRFLAHVDADDIVTINWLTDGAVEPVGGAGRASVDGDGLVRFTVRP